MIKKKFSLANPLQFLMSAVTIVIFACFAYYMYSAAKKNRQQTIINNVYTARFSDIDGIAIGSDVKISGYKIGTVSKMELIPDSYDIRLTLDVASDVKIPKDSIAAVRTSGFIGSKYIAIQPGAEDEFLANEEEILYTQSAINLENLIGKFINK
jgi:phospholipid/cholesterol/gamma-HCH transport system substrate-binding protein